MFKLVNAIANKNKIWIDYKKVQLESSKIPIIKNNLRFSIKMWKKWASDKFKYKVPTIDINPVTCKIDSSEE